MRFDEVEAGYVALVFFPRRPRDPHIKKVPVSHYKWSDESCESIEALRNLRGRTGLERTVLRLELDLSVTLEEEIELEEILDELRGNQAMNGRVAAMLIDRVRVDVHTDDFSLLLPELPSVLRTTVERLQAAEKGEGGALATRALRHLYGLIRKEGVA
jgi:hypothetical protein